MADITAWSATASANTSVNGTNIDTGMSPGNVDNGLREIMAGVKATFSDTTKYTFYSGASGLAVASGGTGASTAGAARTNLGLGTVATLDETTTAQYRANTASKVITTDKAWTAAAPVVLTPAASITLDLSTGINFTLAMGGNYTLANAINGKAGQSGYIQILQDATGGRTLAYDTNYVKAGGTAPVLSTAANATDILTYVVLANTVTLFISLAKAVS